jgi:hypothetical protein
MGRDSGDIAEISDRQHLVKCMTAAELPYPETLAALPRAAAVWYGQNPRLCVCVCVCVCVWYGAVRYYMLCDAYS